MTAPDVAQAILQSAHLSNQILELLITNKKIEDVARTNEQLRDILNNLRPIAQSRENIVATPFEERIMEPKVQGIEGKQLEKAEGRDLQGITIPTETTEILEEKESKYEHFSNT